MNAFIDLDINPAKVVALYPESIAGRLSVAQDEWIPLFGGPKPGKPEQQSTPPTASASTTDVPSTQEAETPPRAPTPQGSIRGMLLKSGLEGLVSGAKDDDAASIRSVRRPPKPGPFAHPARMITLPHAPPPRQTISTAQSSRSCATCLTADRRSPAHSLHSTSRHCSRTRCLFFRRRPRRIYWPSRMPRSRRSRRRNWSALRKSWTLRCSSRTS